MQSIVCQPGMWQSGMSKFLIRSLGINFTPSSPMKWKWDSDLGFQASKTFSIILSAAASESFQISKASFYSKFNELWAELGEKGRDFGPKATIDIVWESNFHLISYFVSSWVWRNVCHQVGPKRLNRIQNWVIKHTKLTQVDYFPPHIAALYLLSIWFRSIWSSRTEKCLTFYELTELGLKNIESSHEEEMRASWRHIFIFSI